MIRVLGPIQIVAADGHTIDLPSASQRRLLAVLAMHAPSPVRAERLAEVLQVSSSGLRTGVTRLRKALGSGALASIAGGYQLTSVVDAQQFCRAVATLPIEPRPIGAGARLATLEEALGLWLGPPFDEFADEEWAAGEAARLTELHAAATEDYAEELVAVHRWSDATAMLCEHIARHPLRDRPRGLMLRALAGAGRQAEALRAYQDYRTMLAEEIGTEPSPQVRRIEQLVAAGWNGSDPEPSPARARTTARRPQPASAGEFPMPLSTARNGPFVGRSKVVADLYDSWQTKQWGALLVTGEPGIGKTRLLAELAHQMHGTGRTVCVGRCDEDFVVSYRPWTELLGPLVQSMSAADETALGPDHLSELHRILPTMSPRLNVTAVPLTGDADAWRSLFVDAVIALLRVVGPVVLVLDDIHWIDQPSLQVLRRVLMASIPDVTILGAYRDTDVDRLDPLAAVLADLRRVEGVRRLTVDGIDDSAVVQLVECSTGQSLDAENIALAHAIRARTAGNPLFVRELISHLDDHHAIAADLPEGLVELIDRRVSRLGNDALGVLRVAAAVGHRFDVGVVEDAVALERTSRDGTTAPATDVLAQLELARDAGVIVDDGEGMEFRHAVIRAALLGQMSTARRQRLHRDVAAVLERIWASSIGQHLEELAYYHDKARTLDAPRWYQRAAKAAADSLDVSAVGLADRGLELLSTTDEPDPALRCDLLIARAVGLRLTGTETIADARRATDAAIALGDKERIASALLSLSVRSIDRDISDHIAFLADGLAHLTDQSQVSRWNVATGLSLRKAMVPSAKAAEHRREILDVVTHLDPNDPLACQIAMRCARSLTSTSMARDAAPIAERFSEGCHGIDSEGLPVELGLSTMWLHLGDRAASDHYLDIAAAHPLRRYWVFDCQVRQRQAMRHLLDGRWSDAAHEIAAARARAAHDPHILVGCDAQMNWLHRETGDVDANYRATCAMAAARPELLLPQAVVASDAAEAGHAKAAQTQLDRLALRSYAGAGREWMTVFALGNLAWAAITIDARRHAPELRRLLANYQGQMAVIGTGTHVLCAIDRLLAGLADLEGDHDDADRLFSAALTQEHAMRSAPLEARTRHWWGRALHRRGDHARAQPLLVQSRATAQALGMIGLVSQIDALQG